MKKVISIVLTTLAGLFEVFGLSVAIGVLLTIPSRQDKMMGGCLFLGFGVCLAATIWSYVSIAKRKKFILLRAFMIKTTSYLSAMAIMFAIAFYDGIPAAILFGFCALLFLLTTLYIENRFRIVESAPVSSGMNLSLRLPEYLARDYMGFAEREYRRIRKLDSNMELMDGEHSQIFQYAAMPIIYLLQWLIEHKMMSDSFYHSFSQDELAAIESGRLSIIEVFQRMEYCFADEDVSGRIKVFLHSYYKDNNGRMPYSLMDRKVFFDYYETLGAENQLFYCLDYSCDDYRKLAAVIDERYREFLSDNQPFTETRIKKAVTWELFGTALDVVCFQKEGETVSNSYVEFCMGALNSLPQRTIDLMFWRIRNEWDDAIKEDTLDVVRSQIQAQFVPDEMIIFPTKDEMQPAFVICGEADFEKEHGVAVTFRDGELLTICYRMDAESPYSVVNERLYQDIVNQCDISAFRDSSRMEEAIAANTIIETELVPESLRDLAQKNEKCYLTTYAYRQKMECDLRLEALRAIRDITSVEYHTTGKGPIPKKLKIKAVSGNRPVFQAAISVGRE